MSTMPCVEFPQVQYIDLSELIHVLKAVTFVTSEHLNLSTTCMVSHSLIAKVSPEWKLNPGFRTQKKCPFPLKRGSVPSIDITNTKIMWTFFGDQILCPLDWGVSWIEVS